MNQTFGVEYSSLSTIIETEAWGFESNKFLNCAVLYSLPIEESDIDNSSLSILKKCKEIERQMGREENIQYDSTGNRIYHARIIDIDILFIGKEKIDTRELTVPHPLIEKRNFVLTPLREIAKDTLKRDFPNYFII